MTEKVAKFRLKEYKINKANIENVSIKEIAERYANFRRHIY